MRRGERLVDLDVGRRDEALWHWVERGDVRPPHTRPSVALVLFDDPQVFVFLHPNAALTRYCKRNLFQHYGIMSRFINT